MDGTVNIFSRGMVLDTIPSLQPEGSYRAAVNAQNETFDYNSFGLVNEPSNELCFSIPEGYDICGWGYIEEREQFIVFSRNIKTNISQIGIGDTKNCTYRILLEDSDESKFVNKLCFSPSEKITPQFKYLNPCNNLWVYWSNGFTYYRLNLDDSFCNLSYDELVLFDCKCPSVIKPSVIEEGSDLLDVGAYQFVCQLIDDDENRTNWFKVSNPVVLESTDNKRGDKSEHAVLLTIENLPKSFPKVAIAVIKTVGGIQTAEVITKLYHNGHKISYIYRGKDKDDEPITLQEILSRRTGYIRGKDLIQRDGRLFLYNILEEWNLDAQDYANRIKTSFVTYAVEAEQASNLPTLPRGEVISIAAVYNFCDGTSSLGFHIAGRKGSDDDFTIIHPDDKRNCTKCDLYKWQVENTAFIEENYCTSSIFEKSYDSQARQQPQHREPEVLYIPITEEDKKWYCKSKTITPTDEDQGYELSEDGCPPEDKGGIENCEDCLQSGSIIEIVKGKVFCEGEECVDGRCPSTGDPCEFCYNCSNDEFKVIRIEESIEHPNVEYSEFDDCPVGEPIYDDEGCRVIGYKPYKVARGKFGYWQSAEKYPETKKCDGSYLYGDLTNTPIRHHLVPDESLIPFHYSKNSGVVSSKRPDNYEWKDTKVFIIGLEVCGVELPPNPPKPYCANNPVSIYWQKVDPADRRVTARGLLTHTFLGKVGNKTYAVPKNGVNSLEFFDKHLDTTESGIEHYRGGFTNNLPIYNFHSPDTNFERAPLTADRLLVPFQLKGTGERYGIYGEGEQPLNMWHTSTNVRGARQSINLNQYQETGERRVVTIPGKCKEDVTFYFNIDGCGTGDFISWNIVVSPSSSKIHSLYATVDGNRFFINGSDVLQGQVRKVSKTINTQCVTFTDVVLTLLEDSCKYTIANVSPCITIGKPIDCKKEISVKRKSDDFKDDEIITYYQGGFNRCIKDISYALADSIVNKGNKFTYPLLNLKREESVYIELPSAVEEARCEDEASFNLTVNGCGGGDLDFSITANVPTTIKFFSCTIDGNKYTSIDGIITGKTKYNPTTYFITDPITGAKTEVYKYQRVTFKDTKLITIDGTYECNYEIGDEVLQVITSGTGSSDYCHKEVTSYAKSTDIVPSSGDGALTLVGGIDSLLSDKKYNGSDAALLDANLTSDASFLGDIHCQSCPIYNASAHYGVLINDSPNQYGRIESATYIPLGMDLTAEEVSCGRADRYGIGDSYVGLYSFRRYSYVSDKIGTLNQQEEPDTYGKFDIGIGSVRLKNLFCLGDCSKIPESCGTDLDNRRDINLREFIYGRYKKCWDGITAFVGKTTPSRDTYHPNTQNTLVHFWTESRINLWKRQSDVCDTYHYDFDKNIPTTKGAEIHYRNLKKLELDPEFPKDTPWNLAWLSRIGIQWSTAALLKKFARLFIKVLILAALGIALGSIGGVLGIALFALLVFADGIQSDICKVIKKLMNDKECIPRCYSGDSNCVADNSKLLPFEKNYNGYNWDFNTQNDLEALIGVTDPYNTCICQVGEGNKILYSNKQNPESITDAYKNFLPNSYINLPADFGKVQSLYLLNNNFYAHTSDMIINIATADGIINLNNGQALEVLTEGGDLRSRPKELVSSVPEGYAGTKDPNAGINTQFGRFTVDRKSKKIFLFNGSAEEISNKGIRNFLKENLDLELAKQFPEYKNVDEVAGVGYRLGFDHRFNKLLFTKIDFKAKDPSKLEVLNGESFRDKETREFIKFSDDRYFIDKSFTLSYDPMHKAWISFHTYFPDGYAYDRDHLYSIKDGGFWKHGDKYGEFQNFFGNYYPHAIEFVIKQRDGVHTTFDSIELDTDVSRYDGVTWIRGIEKTFDRAMLYNDSQNTGFVELEAKNVNNSIESIKQKNGKATVAWEKDLIRINEFSDRNIEPDSAMFENVGNDGLSVLNEHHIGNRQGRLEGKYLIARFILDDPDNSNIQHITKRVNTYQDRTVR